MLAWIIPISDANPPGPGGQPPYPSQGPGFPTHPIAEPPWGWGQQPPYPSQGPGFPTHPIARPPWGWGQQPPYPSQGPGFPTNPIVVPPGGAYPPYPVDPGYGIPETGLNRPSHPINKPPSTEPPEGFEWQMGYLPGVGWAWICVPAQEAPPEAQTK